MSTSLDKAVPSNIQAEEALLGSLMIDSDAVIQVATIVTAEDFYVQRHGWIYEAIRKLHDERQPIDFLTVVDELERRGQLADVGGSAAISSLINAVPSAVHVVTYAEIVQRTSTLRQLITAASQIVRMAYEETQDVQQVVDRSEQLIFSISERRLQRDLEPIRSIMRDVMNELDELHRRKGEVLGVPTGFKALDKLLGGMQRSDLIIVAARPGMGKTSLGLTMALNASKRHGTRVGIFSLEMSSEQLVQRLLSQETRIDSQRLRLGQIQDNEWERIALASGVLSDCPIFIDDSAALTPFELRTKARRLDSEYGVDLLIIDYMQLMYSGNRVENRVQEISFISRSLKQLARELNVPVIAISQLSRQVEARADKKPQLSDLRESGCLIGDTLVSLVGSGQRVPLRTLVGQSGCMVWALNQETWQIEPAAMDRAFCTGTKPVYRLTTRLGRSVRATANHCFLTIDGWKRLDELTIDERIALPRVMPGARQQTMTGSELALLGHLIGDGCTLPHHAIQYTTNELELAEMVSDLADSAFGKKIRPRIVSERQWYQVYLASAEGLTHNVRNPVAAWLDDLGIWGLRSYEKHIPDKIFQQPIDAVALFLRHLWATDGCINMRAGKRSYPAVYYATSSRVLARDVQHLLLRIGINARLKQATPVTRGKDHYHVIVSGNSDLNTFAEHVGAVGTRRTHALAQIQDYLAQHPANTNRDVIPSAIWRHYVRPAMEQAGLSHRELHRKLGMAYGGMTIFRQNVSRDRALRVAEAVGSGALQSLASSDVYWDEIESIRPDGIEEVFDLTIPGHHNFVANDIVVHNSIEQDADVVMFVFREDQYKEESERKNIAEIIVAKHRHGPTGSVDLYFNKEFTHFDELAMVREDIRIE